MTEDEKAELYAKVREAAAGDLEVHVTALKQGEKQYMAMRAEAAMEMRVEAAEKAWIIADVIREVRVKIEKVQAEMRALPDDA